MRICRRLLGHARPFDRQPLQWLVHVSRGQRGTGQYCIAVTSVVTESPSAETWDDNRIKPLYEQLLNQFHTADLDG